MAKKTSDTQTSLAHNSDSHWLKNNQRVFLRKRNSLAVFPDLLSIQKAWFQSFESFYLKKLFDDICPIEDIAWEKLILNINDIKIVKPEIENDADLDRIIEDHKKKETTYGGVINCNIELKDRSSGEIFFESRANIWTMPLMTKNGTYIINWVENIIFSQIVRSYGLFYNQDKKDLCYSFKILPHTWSQIDIVVEKNGVVVCRINKNRKFTITSLLRVLWLETDESITQTFSELFTEEEDFDYVSHTLTKDATYDIGSAAMHIYSKLRPGELVDEENAISYIRSIFFNTDRIKLGTIARRKINSKLDLNNKKNIDYLDLEDIVEALKYLFFLANQRKWYFVDDQDHMNNKRVRIMWELLYSHLQPTMKKFQKTTKWKFSVINLEQKINVNDYLKEDNEEDNDTVEKWNEWAMKNLIWSLIVLDVFDKKWIVVIKAWTKLSSANIKLIQKIEAEEIVVRPNIKLVDIVNFKMIDNQIKQFFATSELSNYADQTNILAELENKRKITALGAWWLKRQTARFDVRDIHLSHYGRICPIETPEWANIWLVINQALYSRINEDGFMETPAIKISQYVDLVEEDMINRVLDRDIKDWDKLVANDGDYIDIDLAKKLIKFLSKDSDIIKVRPYILFNKVEYISPESDHKYTIAEAKIPMDEFGNIWVISHDENKIIDHVNRVPAREYMDISYFHINNLTHIDVDPAQMFSPSTAIIPFVQNDDSSRANMGTNQQRQAVPLVKPEAPLIGTGFEKDVLQWVNATITAEWKWEVIYVWWKNIESNSGYNAMKYIIKVKYEDKKIWNGGIKEYNLSKFIRSNMKTMVHDRPKVSLWQIVDKWDILSEWQSVVDGELSLGKNLRVAFMSWDGYNYEDAIVISQRLVKDDELTSIHIDEYEIEVSDTKLWLEELTNDIPWISLSKLANLDENGIARIWSVVKWWDIIVGKITPKSEWELSAEEKLIQAVFGEKSKNVKDSSLYMPSGSEWKVIDVIILDSKKWDSLVAGVKYKIKVYVAATRKIEVWDKLTGRHGNKGIISKVLSAEDMPYTADGQPIDIILNPLGIISRMNIWQCFETQLGLIAKALDVNFAVPLFSWFGTDEMERLFLWSLSNIDRYELKKAWWNDDQIDDFQKKLKNLNLPSDGKMDIYNGRTGEKFERPVTVGYMYLLKLWHMVEDKIHARNVWPYSLITMQPLGGKARDGWQRFWEMEVWALEAYWAVNTLQEMLTIKSDDIIGRNKTYESIIKWWKVKIWNIPESFHYITYLFRGLLQNIVPLNHERISVIKQLREDKIKSLNLRGVTGMRIDEDSDIVDEVEWISVKEKHQIEKEELIESIVEDFIEYGQIDE